VSPRPGRGAIVALLTALVAGPGWPPPAAGGILEVTDCGDTTPGGGPGQLRALLNAPPPLPNITTIVVPACTITLTGAADDDFNVSGDLDVQGFGTLTIQGSGVGRTFIDGGGVDRVIDVRGGLLTLADLTVRGGLTSAGGGGIRAGSEGLILRRVEVTGNTATGLSSLGGGILALSSNASILILDLSTVSGNSAPDGTGGGVAFASPGYLTVERSTISGNTARRGGGLALAGGDPRSVRITQATLSGNRAVEEGGGLLVDSGVTTWILHSTITENTSERATTGGIFNQQDAQVSLRGSILAANLPADCGGARPLVSAGFNIQGQTSCGLAAAGDQTVADPGLAPLAPAGGPTPTHALQPGSPAIDRAGETGCPSLDQRGVRRPQDGDGDGQARCDVGAVERQGPDASRPAAGGAP
jgi:hypothetical protein